MPRLPRFNLRQSVLATWVAGLMCALALSLVNLFNRGMMPIVLVWVTPLALGLVCGLVARAMLSRRSGWIQALIGASAILLAMLFMGWLTWGVLGWNPSQEPALNRVGLARVAVALLGCALILAAWRAPRSGALASRNAPAPARAGARIQSGSDSVHGGVRLVQPPARDGARTPWLGSRLLARLRRDGRVHLGLTVEERCPYCLEIVLPGDPRGVKRCEVCGTAHHLDCWAAAGACQVLHHHD